MSDLGQRTTCEKTINITATVRPKVAFCGEPSVAMQDGIAVCARHRRREEIVVPDDTALKSKVESLIIPIMDGYYADALDHVVADIIAAVREGT